jgi:uncharacterized protein (TIGR02996 family)
MSDVDGLLADVLENPDEPAPRLILADWLEEHADLGAARAELLRLQVRRGAEPDARRRDVLDWRARQILSERPELKSFLAPLLARRRAEALALTPALAVALAEASASVVAEPFLVGSVWQGVLRADDSSYPTALHLRQRQGNAIEGDMTQDFSWIAVRATFDFRGAVVGRGLTFATHRTDGGGAVPGLYELRLDAEGWLAGSWWLPEGQRHGELRLRLRP